MTDAAIPDSLQVTRVLGGPGCGKTAALLQQTKELVEKGADPADLLLVVPSAQAVLALYDAARRQGVALVGQRVLSIQRLCLEILGAEAGGGQPRLLNQNEELFLLEDLKSTGIKPRRLREMLRFFYRSFTELADEEEGFLEDVDELSCLTVLREQLALRQALLPAELSAKALRALRALRSKASGSEAPAEIRRAHVLADDYGGLNKASQLLVQELATDSLFVTGQPGEVVACAEPYPYPQGLEQLAERRPGLTTVELKLARRSPQRVCSIGNALALHEGQLPDAALAGLDERQPAGSVTVVKWLRSEHELAGVARYVLKRVSGEGPDRLAPEEVFVGVPNRQWGRLLWQGLQKRGLPVAPIISPHKLPGNPQKPESAAAQRLYTALNLAADARDTVAWRSWFGYGDHLTNSAAWLRLCAYSREQGRTPLAALAALHAEDFGRTGDKPPFLQAERLLVAYRQGLELAERLATKKGFGLRKGPWKRLSRRCRACLAVRHRPRCRPSSPSSSTPWTARRAPPSCSPGRRPGSTTRSTRPPACVWAACRPHVTSKPSWSSCQG